MADNTNIQNNTITTSLIQFFDDNSSQFRLSAQDSSLGISIWVPLTNESTGKFTYPKENRFDVVLSADKVEALNSQVQNVLLPAYDQGINISVGVFTNRNRTSFFELGCKDGSFYAAIHLSIDTATITPGKTVVFNFVKTTIVSDFNKPTMKAEPIEGTFYILCKVLNEFTPIASSRLDSHALRYGDKYTRDALFNYLKNIAAKLGVTVESNTRTYSNTNQVAYQQAPTEDVMPETKTVSSMADILS